MVEAPICDLSKALNQGDYMRYVHTHPDGTWDVFAMYTNRMEEYVKSLKRTEQEMETAMTRMTERQGNLL